MWNLNIKINKTETDLIQRTDGWLPEGSAFRELVKASEEQIGSYKTVTEV